MADFIKLAAARKRMCKAIYGETGATCEGCPLREYHDGTPAECNDFILDSPEKAQQIIIKWARKNPEVRMPTWNEWHDEYFPDCKPSFCPQVFVPEERFSCAWNDIGCSRCKDCVIPQDVAAKLGIQPIIIEESIFEEE